MKSGFRFFPTVWFFLLFMISWTYGTQTVSILEEPKNHIPDLSLIGIIVSKDVSSSVAVLQNEESGKTVILSIGESIEDLSLTHVLSDGILLTRGEDVYWILFGEGIRSKIEDETERREKEKGNIDRDIPPLSIDKSKERIFIRSEVQQRVEREWSTIIKEAKVVPNYVEGKIRGFRVKSLPEKSIADDAGICEDDIIIEVNGVALDDLSSLVQLYGTIQKENRYEVLIMRNNRVIRQCYVLK